MPGDDDAMDDSRIGHKGGKGRGAAQHIKNGLVGAHGQRSLWRLDDMRTRPRAHRKGAAARQNDHTGTGRRAAKDRRRARADHDGRVLDDGVDGITLVGSAKGPR